jgi:hypothetical protein
MYQQLSLSSGRTVHFEAEIGVRLEMYRAHGEIERHAKHFETSYVRERSCEVVEIFGGVEISHGTQESVSISRGEIRDQRRDLSDFQQRLSVQSDGQNQDISSSGMDGTYSGSFTERCSDQT